MSLIGKLLVKLGFDGSEFIQGTRQAEQTTQNFTGKISGMFGKMVAGFAIGAAIKKAFDFGKEAYQAAAQAEGVKIAFDRLNDPSLLNNLKEATKGTVDELKMMQLAVQAKNFRLPVEQLGTYLKFATKRAQETGVSVDYLTNSIITGLGRKSVMILDNLGISAVEIREEMKKGGDMAEATSRIIQREMAKAGDITENAAIKAEQISAKWSDFTSNLGNTTLIQKAGNAIQNFLISSIERLNDLVSYWGKSDTDKWISQNITDPSISAAEAAERAASRVKELSTLTINKPRSFWDKLFGNQESALPTSVIKQISDINTSADDKAMQERAAKLAEKLNLEKKSLEELKTLKSQYNTSLYKEEQIIASKIDAIITERTTKQIEKEAEAAEEAKKRAEELRKAQLSYKESENTSAISQLQKQSETYGTTLVYMEELLRLRREQEQYAESDAEYQQLVRSNSELEKKISLRKQAGNGNEVGSEAYLKNQISEAEAAMAKLNTRTAEGRIQWEALAKQIKDAETSISYLPQNVKIDFKIDFGGGEFATWQQEFEASLTSLGEKWEEFIDKRKQSADDLRLVLENGLENSLAGLGEAIGNLASGNTDDIWASLLNPIADMAIQLGELAIATGIGIEGIKKGFESLNPYVAIAAGVALVALGAAVKGAVSGIGKGSGGSSSNGGSTFTGGYSNSTSSNYKTPALASASSRQQVVVLETRVNGSDLMLVQSKEQNRRSR